MLWKRGCVLGLQVCGGLGLGLGGCGLGLGRVGCGLGLGLGGCGLGLGMALEVVALALALDLGVVALLTSLEAEQDFCWGALYCCLKYCRPFFVIPLTL